MVTTIFLETCIAAQIEICFDLSRSIDLHQLSTKHTNEKAVGGRMNGLIEGGESVTWEATHFFIRQRLTSMITAFDRPNFFIDCMTQGVFKSMIHKHTFKKHGNSTIITDEFTYEVPYGMAGQIFNMLLLKRHMRKLLDQRNKIIKKYAESKDRGNFL